MLIKRCLQFQIQQTFTSSLRFSTQKRKDYYEILGIPKEANLQLIKDSYRNLAMKYHPDVNITAEPTNESDAEKFKEAAEAYAVLSNLESRNAYDLLNEQQPERLFKQFRDHQDLFYSTRDEQGLIQRKPYQKGSYAELRQQELQAERDKFNVDLLGRYKGGLPQKDSYGIRRNAKGGSAQGFPGEMHNAEDHNEYATDYPSDQNVDLSRTLDFGNYQNHNKYEMTKRYPGFIATVDYEYFKFESHRQAWRWFRNIFLILFGLPAFFSIILKSRNQRVLKKFLEFQKMNPGARQAVIQGRKVVVGKTGIIKYA